MAKLRTLKKRSFYLVGSLLALIGSYVVVEKTHTTSDTYSENSAFVPFAHADIPASDAASWGGDGGGGDGN